MITKTINLDMTPGGVCPVIHVSQYDKDEDALVFNLYQGSTPFTAGTTATIVGTKPDGYGFSYAASYSNNTVTADLTEQMTAVSGAVICEVRITDGDNTVGTQNFVLMVEPAALANNAVISDSDVPLLQQAIDAAAQAVATASQFYSTGTKIGNSGNLNDTVTSGKYYAEAGQSITNAPIAGGFTMFVWYAFNQYRLVQVVFGVDGSISVRGLGSGGWTAWWSSKFTKLLTAQTVISSATDYNSITTPGEYTFTSTNASRGNNAPNGNSTLAGRLTVEYGMNADYGHLRQTYRYYSAVDTYVRVYNASVPEWTAWTKMV